MHTCVPDCINKSKPSMKTKKHDLLVAEKSHGRSPQGIAAPAARIESAGRNCRIVMGSCIHRNITITTGTVRYTFFFFWWR